MSYQYINLAEELGKLYGPGTDKYEVVGQVLDYIERPGTTKSKSVKKDLPEGRFFVVLEVLGVLDKSGEVSTRGNFFFTRALVQLYTDRTDLKGKFVLVNKVKSGGTVKLKPALDNQQKMVTGFTWKKDGDKWSFEPNGFKVLGKDSNIISGDGNKFLIDSIEKGVITQPNEIEAFCPNVEGKNTMLVTKSLDMDDIIKEGVIELVDQDQVKKEVRDSVKEEEDVKTEGGGIPKLSVEDISIKNMIEVEESENIEKVSGSLPKQDIKRNLVHKLNLNNHSELYAPIISFVKEAGESRVKYVKGVADRVNERSKIEEQDLLSNFAKYVQKGLKRGYIKDKALVDRFTGAFEDDWLSAHRKDGDQVTSEDYKQAVKEYVDDWKTNSDVINQKVLGKYRQQAFAGVAAAIMGIDINKAVKGMANVIENGVVKAGDAIQMMIVNPYLYALAGGGLTFDEAERVYTNISKGYYGVEEDQDLLESRKIFAVIEKFLTSDDIMLTKVDNIKNYIKNTRSIESNGSLLTKEAKDLFEAVTGVGVYKPKGDGLFSISEENKNGFKKYYINVDIEKDFIDKLEEQGWVLGLLWKSDKETKKQPYYILSSYAEKELYVYRKLRLMASCQTGISEEDIERGIKEFEEEKGFKLEKLQKDGVSLVKNKVGMLSGCAGSGKTTTSECMVKILKSMKDINKYGDFIFCAPTGKAAKRLQEVNKDYKVKTLHSEFGLGIGSDSNIIATLNSASNRESEEKVEAGGSGDIVKDVGYSDWDKMDFSYREDMIEEEGDKFQAVVHFKQDDITINKSRRIKNYRPNIYIFDEMGMCNMDVFYEVIRKIHPDSIVYFLGDIKQLLPIGKGAPFRDLMSVLPCVELGVSKRAAEGSGVSYNCDIINNGDKKSYLVETDDFQITPAKSGNVNLELLGTIKKYEKQGYKEDDIQAVSPYNAEKDGFGCAAWNKELQKYFRKDEKTLFCVGKMEFKAGDRVIHSNANNYNYKRYKKGDLTKLVDVESFGVVNGEVGKLVGIIDASKVNFTVQYPEMMIGETTKKARDDEQLKEKALSENNSYYYVVVEYDDIDLGESVYILYWAQKSLYGESKNGIIDLSTNFDMNNLKLAYCLTVHKMQGSQSKVIIAALPDTSRAVFVNRNMIYTAVSRAQEKVDIIGDSNTLNENRLVSNVFDTNSLLTVLSKSEQ